LGNGVTVELPGNGVGDEVSDVVGATSVAKSRYTESHCHLN